MTDLKLKFAGESPFWHFLGSRTVDATEERLPPIAKGLEERAKRLELPVRYPVGHAVAWSVICQLFSMPHPQASSIGQKGFSLMSITFDRFFADKGFWDQGLQTILQNIREPAFVGRSEQETIVDTFLIRGFKLIDASKVPESADVTIVETCLGDQQMCALGKEACTPPEALWNDTIAEYARRRPGALRRNLTKPDSWLFD